MKPDDFEGLVEFRARTLCCPKGCMAKEQNERHASGGCTGQAPAGFVFQVPCNAAMFIEQARASIIAEYEAGIVPCPRIPTVNMNAALWQEGGLRGRFGRALSDVIAASPYTPKEADNDKG